MWLAPEAAAAELANKGSGWDVAAPHLRGWDAAAHRPPDGTLPPAHLRGWDVVVSAVSATPGAGPPFCWESTL